MDMSIEEMKAWHNHVTRWSEAIEFREFLNKVQDAVNKGRKGILTHSEVQYMLMEILSPLDEWDMGDD